MQTDLADLELLLRSRIPIIAVSSNEEERVVEIFREIQTDRDQPLFKWTITDGMTRLDKSMGSQAFVKNPHDALSQIRSTPKPAIYLMMDFHPYLDDPVAVRLLKEVALSYQTVPHVIVLVSHAISVPHELKNLTANFSLALPSPEVITKIIREVANDWSQHNEGKKVNTDRESLEQLIRNLSGLTAHDARSLAQQAIFNNGAILKTDVQFVMEAKYRLLDQNTAVSYDFDTARLSDIGGLKNLKRWLDVRRKSFVEGVDGLERPKGMLLVGVQGCGKSLAAKSVAGSWGVPLLHLDMGALYNKFFGETEKNLREALRMAAAMAPCVLWIDEIEKAVSSDKQDSGTSKRMLGTLLTWMAENKNAVFIVATANDIEGLPPELIRKGRLDEIFFVDLPNSDERSQIFKLHLERRSAKLDRFDIPSLVAQSDGFSGAEIEQAVIAALYLAREEDTCLATAHVSEEIAATRPLSVVMGERIAMLRAWAQDRTVRAN